MFKQVSFLQSPSPIFSQEVNYTSPVHVSEDSNYDWLWSLGILLAIGLWVWLQVRGKNEERDALEENLSPDTKNIRAEFMPKNTPESLQ